MPEKLRVAIVDDHQGIIDGYLYRLNNSLEINVVATTGFGDEIESLFINNQIDVLLLDVSVPASQNSPEPYPILHTIPKLLNQYPKVEILVVTMHCHRDLVRAILASGASGYILKEDQQSLRNLERVILDVANGSIFLSPQVELLIKSQSADNQIKLSKRHIEILSLIASRPNITVSELAEKLHVAKSAVRGLLVDVCVRLRVHNRISAIAKASKLGLITPYIPTLPSLQNTSLKNPTYLKPVLLNLVDSFRTHVLWLLLFILIISFYVLLKILQS